MITVLVWLLTVNLALTSVYVVDSLPDEAECIRLGKIAIVGHPKAWTSCTLHKSLVVSQTGTLPMPALPDGAQYLTTGPLPPK